MELISVLDAAALGIERIRKPIWRIKENHLKLVIVDGHPSIWSYLRSPSNKMVNGRDPVEIPSFGEWVKVKDFVPYDGPLPGSKEYLAACAVFDRYLPPAPPKRRQANLETRTGTLLFKSDSGV